MPKKRKIESFKQLGQFFCNNFEGEIFCVKKNFANPLQYLEDFEKNLVLARNGKKIIKQTLYRPEFYCLKKTQIFIRNNICSLYLHKESMKRKP